MYSFQHRYISVCDENVIENNIQLCHLVNSSHMHVIMKSRSYSTEVYSKKFAHHYDDVIMDTIASQITSLAIVYSIVYSSADQRKHQSSASLAFVRGTQMASYAENISIWWRHNDVVFCCGLLHSILCVCVLSNWQWTVLYCRCVTTLSPCNFTWD